MPTEDNKILKYNHGEKSMKVPFIIYAGLECLLKKWALVIIILKNYQQLKKINIKLIHCLQNVHLMLQKISFVVIEVKTVWKDFVGT